MALMLWNALDLIFKKKEVTAVIIIVFSVQFIWFWFPPMHLVGNDPSFCSVTTL